MTGESRHGSPTTVHFANNHHLVLSIWSSMWPGMMQSNRNFTSITQYCHYGTPILGYCQSGAGVGYPAGCGSDDACTHQAP